MAESAVKTAIFIKIEAPPLSKFRIGCSRIPTNTITLSNIYYDTGSTRQTQSFIRHRVKQERMRLPKKVKIAAALIRMKN
jgi:hypothetical protein